MRGLPRLAECRDCAEPIRFVNLPNGGCVPVQPKPHPTAGTVAAQVVSGRLYGHFIAAHDPASAADICFTPHNAVCRERPRAPLTTSTKTEPAVEPDLFTTTEETP